MKITDLLDSGQSQDDFANTDDSSGRAVEIVVQTKTIKHFTVNELFKLINGLGHNIGRYLFPDEVALVNCIVLLGLQDDNYYPTKVVESIAKYLQAKCELNRALVRSE